MGTNTIDIMRGTGFGDRRAGRIRTLTVADSDALAEQSYIASSTPTTSKSGTITWRNQDVTARLNGVGEQYFDVKGLELAAGRNLSARDVETGAAVVIIDDNTGPICSPTAKTLSARCCCSTSNPWKLSAWPKNRTPPSARPTPSTCGRRTPRS